MSRRDNIKKLLVNYNRRLQALQERKALYGLDTPIAILTEIEEIETQIEELQTEFHYPTWGGIRIRVKNRHNTKTFKGES